MFENGSDGTDTTSPDPAEPAAPAWGAGPGADRATEHREPDPSTVYSAEEERMVTERLQALGYIE